jgi:hypothetical protein
MSAAARKLDGEVWMITNVWVMDKDAQVGRSGGRPRQLHVGPTKRDYVPPTERG